MKTINTKKINNILQNSKLNLNVMKMGQHWNTNINSVSVTYEGKNMIKKLLL